MTREEARLLLQSYRPELDQNEPEFVEALQMAASDPELARWFAEEQAFDRAMAAQLEAIPAPFGLRTRILAQAPGKSTTRPVWSWIVKLAGAVALVFLLFQVANFFRPSTAKTAQVTNYAHEMVSFIRLGGTLDMESQNLGKIEDWLGHHSGATPNVPPRMASLQPIGCRLLSFRGQKVTLICFQRDDSRMAHLFVVDRSALPEVKAGAPPIFNRAGDWTTASWVENNQVYTIAVQGDQATARKFLPSA